jgi:hypothetical protein
MSAKRKIAQKTSSAGDDVDANLDAIERLLATAAELMRTQAGLERDAFEYLRRLRLRVRSARAAQAAKAVIPSEKWSTRTDLNEDPISFTRRVFGPLLASGQYSRADLKRWDMSLYTAVTNHVARHGQPADFLPTKPQLLSRKLAHAKEVRQPSRTKKVAELSEGEQQQLRLYDMQRARRKRRDRLP